MALRFEQYHPPFLQSPTVPFGRPLQAGHGSNSRVSVTTGATLTAAQVGSGYIVSTASTASTLTLPTGTLLGAYLGCEQGDTIDLFVDNTAGTALGTITMAVATNGVKSDAANTTAGSFGQLTVTTGATGIGCFRLMFSSATAYVFTRIA